MTQHFVLANRRRIFAARQNDKFTRAAILVAFSFTMLTACQPEGPSALSLEEAKKATARFEGQSFTPPPKTIVDVNKLLESHIKMRPEAADAARRYKLRADQKTPTDLSGHQLARFLMRRGSAARVIGRLHQSVADMRRAEELTRDLRNRFREDVLWRLATSEEGGGNARNTIRWREEALGLIDGRARKIGRGATLANTYATYGNLDAADSQISDVEDLIALGLNNRYAKNVLYRVERAKGQIEQLKGRSSDAERIYRGALEISRTAPVRNDADRRMMYDMRRNLSEVLVQQGRYVEAEVEVRRSLRDSLKQFGRYSFITSEHLSQFLRVLTEQGRYAEAEELAKVLVDVYRKIGAAEESFNYNNARVRLADLYVNQRRWADAVKLYDVVMRNLADDVNAQNRIVATNMNRVIALVMAGQALAAKEAATHTAVLRTKSLGANHYDTAEAQGLLAMTRAALGEREEALKLFRGAIPILLTRSRASDDNQTTKASRALRLGIILDAYVRLLADISATALETKEGDAAANAFRIADVARARSVQAALGASAARAAARDPALADLVRRVQDTQKQISALFGLYANALSLPADQQDSKALAALRTRIDTLRGARAALAREIEKRFPDYAALMNPKPATIAVVQKALRPGEALIATYVGERASYVWAVPKSGKAAFAAVPLGRAQVGAAVRQLRRALDPQAATLGDIPAFDVAVAHKLYRALLGPVEGGWKGAKSLLVVAHGPLGQLPFSVLVTKEGKIGPENAPLFSNYRDVAFLARSHAVTVLPSVSAMATLRALPAASPTRRAFAGFGDPLFSAEQAKASLVQAPAAQTAAVATRGVLRVRGLPIHLRSAPKLDGVASADLAKLPRLPDTADEVRGIAVAMNADLTRDVFTGKDASEGRVKSMKLSGYKVLAFATHGLVPGDLNGLTQPALALSSPEVAGGKDDGLLTMGEILGLRLDADWVVLSACNTASGDGAGAEAVSGLGRAFFYAGTRALLVSNWPVETTSARTLTTYIFKRQAANAMLTRAEALRRSMLELIDKGGLKDGEGRVVFSYAHPIFWAPFSLVGDGGGKPAG